MNRALILVACLLAASVLGGCAAKSEESTSSAPPASNVQELVLQAPPVPTNGSLEVGLSTVFRLDAASAPGGALTSFLLTIPAGAVFEEEIFPGFTLERLALGFLPLNSTPAPETLESFSIFVFRVDETNADLVSAYIRPHFTGSSGIGPLQTPIDEAPSLAGDYVHLPNNLDEGTRIAVVVAIDGAAAPVSLLLRFMDREIGFGEDPPTTVSDLVGPNDGLVSLPPFATGTGVQYAAYSQITALFAITGEVQSGPVNIQDALPRQDIGATVRDAIISAPGPDRGYSYATGLYFGYEAHGLWSVEGNLHGTPVEARSIIAQDFAPPTVGIIGILLFGLPAYVYIGEGSGASDAAFHVQVANVNEFQLFSYAKLDLGATLLELTGKPGLTGGSAFTGLAGNVPPSFLHRAGDQLIQFTEGRFLSTPLPV
ncbi:MAG: hypothetical protein AABX89_02955 [Candidatus Thermoplasmatota archaeon]